MTTPTDSDPGTGLRPPDERTQTTEQAIRDSIDNPPLLNLLWFPLLFLVGLPLLAWVAWFIGDMLGVRTHYVLIALGVMFTALAAWRGWSPGLVERQHRASQAELARPGLARILSKLEPWLFVLAGMVLGTAWLARLFAGVELGVGGFAFLFGGWYVGGVLGMTLAMFTRDYLRDRYAPRLAIGFTVAVLLVVRLSAYLQGVA
ncbi:MAG: hypothetical protein HKN15_11505 [Xanthomonadales bacterium]|nr:hypothetical protein [Xanthomonadales bacterium]